MIQIDDKLISMDVMEKRFVCDLAACKGACCVEGDMGAPLEDEETQKLVDVYDEVKPYLREEGIKAIEEQGLFIKDDYDDEWVTPLVDGKECAYTTFDPDGTAKCGIEAAYRDRKIDFYKPISCHLYPVRIKEYADFEALNYDEWSICKPACSCGSKLDIKVYQFVKAPLIRKYGEAWYNELVEADKALENMKNDSE